MSNAEERLARIQQLVEQFSPSIIPDLRGRARRERDAARASGEPYRTFGKPWPVYGVDHVADFVEAVFAEFPETWAAKTNWSVHDELRNYGRPTT